MSEMSPPTGARLCAQWRARADEARTHATAATSADERMFQIATAAAWTTAVQELESLIAFTSQEEGKP